MYVLNYQKVWSSLYWIFGMSASTLFVFGGLYLGDCTLFLYLLASLYLVAIGISMSKNPYCIYGLTEIKVFGHFRKMRKIYRFDGPSDILVRNNRLYINGRKLRFNAWFINEEEWKRMIIFYSPDDILIHELNEL